MLNFKELFFELPLPPKIKKSVIALEIAKSLGIEIIGERFSPILRKNQHYPIQHSEIYTTTIDLQAISSYTLVILEKLEKKVPPELRPLFQQIRFKINPALFKKETNLEKKENKIKSEALENCLKSVSEVLKDSELEDIFIKVIQKYFMAKSRTYGSS